MIWLYCLWYIYICIIWKRRCNRPVVWVTYIIHIGRIVGIISIIIISSCSCSSIVIRSIVTIIVIQLKFSSHLRIFVCCIHQGLVYLREGRNAVLQKSKWILVCTIIIIAVAVVIKSGRRTKGHRIAMTIVAVVIALWEGSIVNPLIVDARIQKRRKGKERR